MVGIKPLIVPVGALAVFWDINRCPVPVDCDARRVGPCIERFLRKLGHSGPISITAVGTLSKVPKKILEAVSSTGIRLYEVPYGRKSIDSHIRIYFYLNPSPAHVMLISPPRYFATLLSQHAMMEGCHIILPFPSDSSPADANFLWKELLLQEVHCGAFEEEDVETVEPANWVCGVCDNLPGRGFENFLTHLSSQEHAREITPWYGNLGKYTFPTMVGEKVSRIEPMVKEEATDDDDDDDEAMLRILLDLD